MSPKKKSDIQMNNLFDLFLENRNRNLKESTFSKYYRDINNHLKPYWGNLKLCEISNLKIEKHTEYLLSKVNIYTGIRIGELCALQWKNISIENGTLYIESAIQRTSKADGTKGT